MSGLRTCQLRHDKEAFQTVHNALARVYMAAGQWDGLARLIKNCPFPAETASHNQLARHHYYVAKLAAVQLDYAKAFECLEQALRKAPTDSRPFRVTCLKLLIVVKLLMGEIPGLALFKDDRLPVYYKLTKAVRKGDLKAFQETLTTNTSAFVRDDTESLVLRLHQNVLKAGLKRISLCYSKISIADVASLLGLQSPDDCLMVVMKAIRDGVISGSVTPDGTVFVSSFRQAADNERHGQLGLLEHRIVQCQSLIQEAVKAMRFPHAVPGGKKPLGGEVKKDGAGKSPSELTPSVDFEDDDDLMMMEEDFF
jgi:26S proteasome regulatory subunit N3